MLLDYSVSLPNLLNSEIFSLFSPPRFRFPGLLCAQSSRVQTEISLSVLNLWPFPSLSRLAAVIREGSARLWPLSETLTVAVSLFLFP